MSLVGSRGGGLRARFKMAWLLAIATGGGHRAVHAIDAADLHPVRQRQL